MSELKPLRVRTIHSYDRPDIKRPNFHPMVSVQYIQTDEPKFYCGDSWCSGECGLPALIIPADGNRREQKAYSDVVACGPLMQNWRIKDWVGTKEEVPAEYRPWFRNGMWW